MIMNEEDIETVTIAHVAIGQALDKLRFARRVFAKRNLDRAVGRVEAAIAAVNAANSGAHGAVLHVKNVVHGQDEQRKRWELT
jgi:hypothetical protein